MTCTEASGVEGSPVYNVLASPHIKEGSDEAARRYSRPACCVRVCVCVHVCGVCSVQGSRFFCAMCGALVRGRTFGLCPSMPRHARPSATSTAMAIVTWSWPAEERAGGRREAGL